MNTLTFDDGLETEWTVTAHEPDLVFVQDPVALACGSYRVFFGNR